MLTNNRNLLIQDSYQKQAIEASLLNDGQLIDVQIPTDPFIIGQDLTVTCYLLHP